MTSTSTSVRRLIGYPSETLKRCITFFLSLPEILLKKEAEIVLSALLWILITFKDLQDALLAVGLIRSWALAAFERQYSEVCGDALRKPR